MFLEPRFASSASAAFTIVGELLQRLPSPSGIHPRITQPGGGQYYCLSLFHKDAGNLADFNLSTGRLHIHNTLGASDMGNVEGWREPRSFFLAAMTQNYAMSRIAEDVLAGLGIPTAVPEGRAGLTHSAIGALLRRFIYEDGIMVENGWANQYGHSEWIGEAPDDWIGEPYYDVAAGQLWRLTYRRSVIFDDSVEAAFLVGNGEMVSLTSSNSDSPYSAVNRIEEHLRG